MTATSTNGAPADNEAAAKRVVFATPDELPDLPAGLKRQPRPGEARFDYLVTIAREVGIVAGDASLDAEQKQRYCLEMLALAAEDEVWGGSKAGRAIQQADTLWNQRNPKLAAELLGHLSDSARDLSGRAVRGPARAVAILLERLAEDPNRPISDVETELLTSLTPGVIEAHAERERNADEQREAFLVAVNAAQITYPAGEPGVPIVREEVTS